MNRALLPWGIPAAAFALAAPLYLLWPQATAPTSRAPLKLTDLRPPVVAELGAALKQPAFAADRTPKASASEEDASANLSSVPVPTLVGVISGARGTGVALVRGADGKSEAVRVGKTTSGWRLLAVGARQATFVLGANQQTIKLDFTRQQNGTGSATGTQAAASIQPAQGQVSADEGTAKVVTDGPTR